MEAFQVFKCIRRRDGVAAQDVLEIAYPSIESLEDRFVVFDKLRVNYLVFRTLDDYKLHWAGVEPTHRCFNEVVFGSRRQRLKFDIDVKEFDGDFSPVLTRIIDLIRDVYFLLWQSDMGEPKIADASSGSLKSYHIILPATVNSSLQAAAFTGHVKQYMSDEDAKYVDWGVNKRIQNFRLVGCVKPGSSRVLRCNDPLEDTVICPGDGTGAGPCLTELTIQEAGAVGNEVTDENEKRILDMVIPHIGDAHTFRYRVGDLFVFDRVRGSHCAICNADHDRDNTMLANANNFGGVVTVSIKCRKSGPWIKVGEYVSDRVPPGVEPARAWGVNAIDRAVADDKRLTTGKMFNTLASKNVYDEPSLRPFEFVDTLCVNARMKMGKTKQLLDYMARNFIDGIDEKIIRFLSFRQTFSANIKEKFPTFVMYSDVKGPLTQSKLIIQVESLHRVYIGGDFPDLLILDECESIFEQFGSGLAKQSTPAFAAFQWLIKYSKHVVCMDAFLSDRTFTILKEMRPDFGGPGTMYHRNVYKNGTEDKYLITNEHAEWLSGLYEDIENGLRVAVPISSLTQARVIFETIGKRFPDKRVMIYSSETLISERKKHFADVNTYWAAYDVIIYTPTVSAGVSFEVAHFDKVYGYFIDSSCPVETCMQMLGRVRNVRLKEYVIYLAGFGGRLPTTAEQLKAHVNKHRDNLMAAFDGAALTFEYTANGDIEYHHGAFYTIWLENLKIKNMSKNNFIGRFTKFAKDTGASVARLTGKVTAGIAEQHYGTTIELRDAQCKAIAETPDVDPEEIEEIRRAQREQEDVTADMRNRLFRRQLRNAYNFDGEITQRFVKIYDKQSARRTYRNLVRIYSAPTISESLLIIQAAERSIYEYSLTQEVESRSYDITYRRVFDQHRAAIKILFACGWTALDDPRWIPAVELAANLRFAEREITTDGPMLVNDGVISKLPVIVGRDDDGAFLDAITPFVKQILSHVYGLKLTPKDEMWRITRPLLFVYGQNVSPVKPRVAY